MSLGIVTVGLDSRVSATCIESLGLRLTGAGFQDQVGITDFPSSVFEALQHPGGQSARPVERTCPHPLHLTCALVESAEAATRSSSRPVHENDEEPGRSVELGLAGSGHLDVLAVSSVVLVAQTDQQRLHLWIAGSDPSNLHCKILAPRSTGTHPWVRSMGLFGFQRGVPGEIRRAHKPRRGRCKGVNWDCGGPPGSRSRHLGIKSRSQIVLIDALCPSGLVELGRHSSGSA